MTKVLTLSEREQKAPEELKWEIGGAVAILDVKDYIKECER